MLLRYISEMQTICLQTTNRNCIEHMTVLKLWLYKILSKYSTIKLIVFVKYIMLTYI